MAKKNLQSLKALHEDLIRQANEIQTQMDLLESWNTMEAGRGEMRVWWSGARDRDEMIIEFGNNHIMKARVVVDGERGRYLLWTLRHLIENEEPQLDYKLIMKIVAMLNSEYVKPGHGDEFVNQLRKCSEQLSLLAKFF